jgi:hypothetical protein
VHPSSHAVAQRYYLRAVRRAAAPTYKDYVDKKKKDKKAMTLRSKIVRLAHARPDLRPDLLPLLRRASRAQKPLAEVAVGDIFYSSWGYDQTNVDFYQVIKRTATTVTVAEIRSKIVGGQGGPSEKVMPMVGSFDARGKKGRKKLKEYDGTPYVQMSSYEHAYLWDGKPQSQTGGAYGH